MIDTNAINNASNYLVQAGYTIKAAPLPEVYSTAMQSIVTVGLAVFTAIAAIGRAWHAIQNQASVFRALVLGTNTPKNLVAQVNSNTAVVQGATPPPPTTVPTPTPPTVKTIVA